MREKKTLAWASVSHFFIDFLCAWLITHQLIENGSWFFLLFLYNFLAFAAQLPLGILLDALCAQRMAGRAGAMGRLLQDNARLITAGTGCLFCGARCCRGLGICLSSFCAAPETPCSMWEPAQIFWRKVRERHGRPGFSSPSELSGSLPEPSFLCLRVGESWRDVFLSSCVPFSFLCAEDVTARVCAGILQSMPRCFHGTEEGWL